MFSVLGANRSLLCFWLSILFKQSSYNNNKWYIRGFKPGMSAWQRGSRTNHDQRPGQEIWEYKRKRIYDTPNPIRRYFLSKIVSLIYIFDTFVWLGGTNCIFINIYCTVCNFLYCQKETWPSGHMKVKLNPTGGAGCNSGKFISSPLFFYIQPFQLIFFILIWLNIF